MLHDYYEEDLQRLEAIAGRTLDEWRGEGNGDAG
jgi:hypothetical protein